MITFVEWLESNLYRVDGDKIADFSSKMRTYRHAPDWSSSGTFGTDEEVPDGWGQATGLFTAELRHVVAYAVPRSTKWVVTWENPKRPTIYFNENDRRAIASHQPTLSTFNKSDFQQLPSKEFFTDKPSNPTKQETIRNPLNFIRRWYDVQFVPNVVEKAKQLKSQNLHFNSEGLGT